MFRTQLSNSKHLRKSHNRVRKQHLRCEQLEDRRMMANDLGTILGSVFLDADNDGVHDTAESAVPSTVNIQLTGPGGTRTMQTLSDGSYRFDGLTSGTYIVSQLSAASGSAIRPGSSPQSVTITPAAAAGRVGQVIDNFDHTQQMVAASLLTTNSASISSSTVSGEAIGGERDMSVRLKSSNGRVTLASNADIKGVLDFGTLFGTVGEAKIVWDGVDSNANSINTQGLNTDLTASGSDRIRLVAGAELGGGNATMRIYSGPAGTPTEVRFSIPQTAPGTTQPIDISMAAFVGADLTDVGAIELVLDPQNTADGVVDSIETFGPTLHVVNFANISKIDLELTKTLVSNAASPVIGDNADFQITVINKGPSVATGVQVTDQLPAGLTYVTHATAHGNYNPGTGVWTIGTLPVNGTATLSIGTEIATAGKKINIAQVSAADQMDMDSTPNNNVATEDDQAMAMVTPGSPKINLTKATNGVAIDTATGGPSVLVGSTVTFTYIVTNTGDVPLRNVTVSDDHGTPGNTADDFFANYSSGDADGDSLLDTTETWRYVATAVATQGRYVNRAKVKGFTAVGDTMVMDDSVSNHTGLALPPPPTPQGDHGLSKRSFLASRFR